MSYAEVTQQTQKQLFICCVSGLWIVLYCSARLMSSCNPCSINRIAVTDTFIQSKYTLNDSLNALLLVYNPRKAVFNDAEQVINIHVCTRGVHEWLIFLSARACLWEPNVPTRRGIPGTRAKQTNRQKFSFWLLGFDLALALVMMSMVGLHKDYMGVRMRTVFEVWILLVSNIQFQVSTWRVVKVVIFWGTGYS